MGVRGCVADGEVLRPVRQPGVRLHRRAHLRQQRGGAAADAGHRAGVPVDGAAGRLPRHPCVPRRRRQQVRDGEEAAGHVPGVLDHPGRVGVCHRAAGVPHQRRGAPEPAVLGRLRLPRAVGAGLRHRVHCGRSEVPLQERPRQQGALHHRGAVEPEPPPQLLRRNPDVVGGGRGGHLHERVAGDLVRLSAQPVVRHPAADPGERSAHPGEGGGRAVGQRVVVPGVQEEHPVPRAQAARDVILRAAARGAV
mmetsp:Transcript_17572/g.43382  ORF Transcript_17572/g.43382 Transcript_17572/m.43382 type:complete len:251 (+) Transcript_17572:459-1211(+)